MSWYRNQYRQQHTRPPTGCCAKRPRKTRCRPRRHLGACRTWHKPHVVRRQWHLVRSGCDSSHVSACNGSSVYHRTAQLFRSPHDACINSWPHPQRAMPGTGREEPASLVAAPYYFCSRHVVRRVRVGIQILYSHAPTVYFSCPLTMKCCFVLLRFPSATRHRSPPMSLHTVATLHRTRSASSGYYKLHIASLSIHSISSPHRSTTPIPPAHIE